MSDEKGDESKVNVSSGSGTTIGGDIAGRDIIKMGVNIIQSNQGMVIVAVVALVSIVAIVAVLTTLKDNAVAFTPTTSAIVAIPANSLPTSTVFPIPTPSLESIFSLAPTLSSVTVTATSIPPTVSPSNTPDPRLRSGCIVDTEWTFVPFDTHEGNGCLKLGDFFGTKSGVSLQPSTRLGQNRQRGIYTPILGDSDIQLTISITNFIVPSKELKGGSNMVVAIVGLNPSFSYQGVLLYYYGSLRSEPFATARIQLVDETGFQQTLLSSSPLAYQEEQNIKFSLRGNTLTVNADRLGQKSIVLPSEGRALYIGYNLKEDSSLNADVSKLSIQLVR